jgi:hypothetical protein
MRKGSQSSRTVSSCWCSRSRILLRVGSATARKIRSCRWCRMLRIIHSQMAMCQEANVRCLQHCPQSPILVGTKASASGNSPQKASSRLTDSQSTKDPIRSVHTMVSTPYRVDALTLCPKTCPRFSYTLVCRADPAARFRAIRTISSSGCWYCIAVLTSLWPIVFITAARFPVLFSTRVPYSCRLQYRTRSLASPAFARAVRNCFAVK